MLVSKRSRNSSISDEQDEENVRKVLRTFESLPSLHQDNLLSQLIDKCSKKQLSFISNIVMPRLKIDILSSVPREIALYIVSSLPVKSLCRLAQTCRYHRDLVNDGQLWRRLLVKYDFVSNDHFADTILSGSPTSASNSCSSLIPPAVSLSFDNNSANSSGCPSPPPHSASSTIDSKQQQHSPNRSLCSASSINNDGNLSQLTHKHIFQTEYMLRSNWTHGRCNQFSIHGPQSAIVTCLQFDKDILAIATDNSTFGLIEIFHSRSGHRLRKLSGHEGGVWALQFIDNVLVSGGCDRDLRVWDLESGQCKYRLRGHTSTIRCLQMVDKSTVVTGSRDNSVRVWDIEQGVCKRIFEGHTGSVRCLALHNNIVVSGSYDCTLRVWDLKSEKLLHVLQQHHAQIYSVTCNNMYICSGSLDADVRVWDVKTGKCLWTLEGHDALVGHMQLRGNILVTGGSDGRICIWNVDTGELINRIQAHFNSVTTLQFDEQRILSGGDDGIKVWDFKTSTLIRSFAEDVSGVWRLQFDKSRLVSATQRQDDSFIEIMDFTPQILVSNSSMTQL